MSKSKEALALLDDLDSFVPPPSTSTATSTTTRPKSSSLAPPPSGSAPVNDKDAADALAFLDEITQKSSEPRKAMPSTTTRVTLGGSSRPSTPGIPTSARKSVDVPRPASRSQELASDAGSAAGGGGWGWGNVWNTASAALAQAKEKVDEQVKNLPQVPQTDQAKKWGEGMMDYVKQAHLDKLGAFLTSRISSSC